MSGGFSDEAFSLDALHNARPSTEALADFHHALLVEGCRERLLVCARLIEQRLAELELEPPLLPGALSESVDRSFDSDSGRPESFRDDS
jgi:hypothetical protein